MTETPDRARIAVRPPEAAKLLGISPRFLTTLVKRGEIPHVRVSAKCLLFRPADLDAWLAKRAQTGGAA